jgi:hypothetical protein
VVLEYRDGSLRIGLHTIGVEWRGSCLLLY